MECPKEANTKALDILNKGVDSLAFRVKAKELNAEYIETLLEGICADCVELNFYTCQGHVVELAEILVAYFRKKEYDLTKLQGSIGYDFFDKMLAKGKEKGDMLATAKALIEATAALPEYRVLNVTALTLNNAGSYIYQELGYALAWGNEYLNQLTEAGVPAAVVARKIKFNFGISSNYFLEIAKFRAARMLWANIVASYDAEAKCAAKMRVHAETSTFNLTLFDAHVNLLRTQTEAMSAALGGVDSMTVSPFDKTYAAPDEFSERMARNQQLLLKEESHFAKIVDVAGGSYYIEELTQNIAEAAWKLFLETQEQGGYIEALKKGFVQAAVKATAQARDLAIAQRKENFVGVNQFPNFNEKIDRQLCACIFEPEDETAEGAEIETLKPYRGPAAFEAMRLQTDAFSAKNGRPVVYMFPMGNLAMRKARAQFACNFFACAGFEVKDNNGFKTVDEGVQACLDNKAAIVVLCSSDDEYAGFAPEAFEKLKDKAIVVVAGNPESRPELEAKGLLNYIHVKNNVLEELKGYQVKLGIK